MRILNGKYNHANVMIDDIDETTEAQIKSFLDHPVFAKTHIAIMPDCHAGAGAVIGFTARIKDYVIPNVVGVDIGCGITATNLGNIDIDLPAFNIFVREHIPSGTKHRDTPHASMRDGWYYQDRTQKICERLSLDYRDVMCQAGTLGGGNHFIELDKDGEGNIWLLIHTGSRNFGLKVATYWQKKAAHLTNKMCVDVPTGLEFLPMEFGGHDYLSDMTVAQFFAACNRRTIGTILIKYLLPSCQQLATTIESVHNYIDPSMMIRKGAISAMAGESLVIPLNMRDGVIIGTGKGNSLWNNSAPHGAGRVMSRMQAKRELTMDSFTESMMGVYSSCISADTLDEAPAAYKAPGVIIGAIGDTVDIQAALKPVYNFKAEA